MAGVTWTRTVTRRQMPSSGAIERAVLSAVDALGKRGVTTLQTQIWAVRRFKRPTGRSTKAWTYAMKARNGRQELRFINGAVSSRGVNYPRYVHLSGRPKTDVLMLEVEAWSRDVVAPELGRVCAEAYVDTRAAMPLKTTTERVS